MATVTKSKKSRPKVRSAPVEGPMAFPTHRLIVVHRDGHEDPTDNYDTAEGAKRRIKFWASMNKHGDWPTMRAVPLETRQVYRLVHLSKDGPKVLVDGIADKANAIERAARFTLRGLYCLAMEQTVVVIREVDVTGNPDDLLVSRKAVEA